MNFIKISIVLCALLFSISISAQDTCTVYKVRYATQKNTFKTDEGCITKSEQSIMLHRHNTTNVSINKEAIRSIKAETGKNRAAGALIGMLVGSISGPVIAVAVGPKGKFTRLPELFSGALGLVGGTAVGGIIGYNIGKKTYQEVRFKDLR